MVSEITPLLIITKLEQYDYAGATAIAVSMLVISFTLLLVINGLQWWSHSRRSASASSGGHEPVVDKPGFARAHARPNPAAPIAERP